MATAASNFDYNKRMMLEQIRTVSDDIEGTTNTEEIRIMLNYLADLVSHNLMIIKEGF